MLLSRLLNKIEYIGNFVDCEVSDITNDSRIATSSSIFVCIKGFTTNGHLFATSAYANGCRVFVCEEQIDLPSDARIIMVKNTRIALAQLSCILYDNPSEKMAIIGITGTKGKTSTALMIKQLLDGAGIPCGYIGSNGVLYGEEKYDTTNTTPESYILQKHFHDMANSGIKAAVIEVSSQALKLHRTFGTKFAFTIFTNLSPDHIGAGEHDSFEDYFLAKKMLFDNYEAQTVIANADDIHTKSMLADCKSHTVFYSTESKTDYTAHSICTYRDENTLGMTFDCHAGERVIPCTISIPGKINIYNTLAAMCVADHFNIDLNLAAQILRKIQIEGRFEVVTTPKGASFVIDYAHNGLSLEAALKALKKYNPNRLICLFGSVGGRTQVRRTQLGNAASKFADFSIITSDNPNHEDPMAIINEIAACFNDQSKYTCIKDREIAIQYAYEMAQNGDIILLAGKGHEIYQLINGKNEYFCEREILHECIGNLKKLIIESKI